MLMSATMDLDLTEVVDVVKGAHAMMPKAVFRKQHGIASSPGVRPRRSMNLLLSEASEYRVLADVNTSMCRRTGSFLVGEVERKAPGLGDSRHCGAVRGGLGHRPDVHRRLQPLLA